MTKDEARKKAKRVLLGYVILEVGPFFLLTIFFGFILANTLVPPSLYGKITATLSHVGVMLMNVVIWGKVAADRYRKVDNNPEK